MPFICSRPNTIYVQSPVFFNFDRRYWFWKSWFWKISSFKKCKWINLQSKTWWNAVYARRILALHEVSNSRIFDEFESFSKKTKQFSQSNLQCIFHASLWQFHAKKKRTSLDWLQKRKSDCWYTQKPIKNPDLYRDSFYLLISVKYL